ncbi:MAG: hypothetical protein HYV07_24875 [Deltaproteobacteria bacterium]|nr:hypothetical protein [Deltaproteobacteria bacterium]
MTPVGQTEVDELEGRLDASSWSGAPAEKAKIVALRTEYENALEARRAGRHACSDLRAVRDGVKEDFLNVFAQVAARVKAEYPRDRKLLDFFFDDLESGPEEAAESEEDVPTPVTGED